MKAETKVGIMVTLALVILIVMIFLVGNIRFGPGGTTLNVLFTFVNNIKVDARVLYAGGATIGRVQDIKSDGDMVRLVLVIDPGVKIRRDAEITIYSQGLLGEKYVEVNTVEGSAPAGGVSYYSSNEVTRGSDPISGDSTMVTLHKIADALRGVIGDPEMKAALIRTVKNAGTMTDTLNKLIVDNAENVNGALKNFHAMSGSLQTLSRDLQSLLSNMNDLVSAKNKDELQGTIRNLDKITTQLELTSKALSSITTKVDKGEGTLGLLVSDKEMAEDLKVLVRDLKTNPWKLIWKK